MSLSVKLMVTFSIGAVMLLSSCKDGSKNSAEKQHTADTTKAAADTIPARIAEYTTRINSNPKDANALWNRGKLEVLQKNLQGAFTDLSKCVKLDSTKDGYYSSLADVEFMMGHTREAKDGFEKCISINPGNTTALLKLGEIYFYVRKYKESMELADKALKINVHLAKAYFMKGMIFLEVHDTAKAVSSLQTAIEQDSKYYDACIQLGLIYSRRGNSHAVDYFNAAQNINQQNVESYYDKAMFYQSGGDYDNAVKNYNQLLQIDSTYKYALYNMGYISYANSKDYKKAIYYFSRALKSDSLYTMAYFARGNCYEEVNDLKNAETDFAHAVKQKPEFTEAQQAYKEVKAKLK